MHIGGVCRGQNFRGGGTMRCLYCNCTESRVIDSRSADDDRTIRRRRECVNCGRRFTTYETIEMTPILVVKSDGNRQAFDSGKIKRGIVKAAEKRPIPIEKIDALVDDITKRVAAKVAGKELVLFPEAEEMVRARFAQYHKEMQLNNLSQAMFTPDSRLLLNPNGTAPGAIVPMGGEILTYKVYLIQDGTIKYYMIKNGDKGYVPMTKEEATAYLGYEPTVEGDNTSETSSAAENGGETEPEAEAEETGIKPTRASGAPDSGNYWRDEAQTVSSVWSEMTSKDSIVEATSDYASLSNKPFEFAAFLKGEGETARTGEPESELEAQELVYANAEAFQNLYSALKAENILAKYNLSGCGEDIKSYLDGFDKGDFNQDGDYSDDYKYLPNGTENPDKKD